ncbi:MAG: hypothetical protein QME07_01605 [bacterium]|nr:hypothetical protein [bacterium]
MKKRKKKPQISQIFKKETIVVGGILLLGLILRLIYLAHLKANDPDFLQPAPGTDMLTYHNLAQQIQEVSYALLFFATRLPSFFHDNFIAYS